MIRLKCLLFMMMFSLMVISQQAWAEIFVASYDNNSIRVFDNQDTGNVVPKRVIEGGSTGLSDPAGVYVDGGEIFVSNYGNDTITVYRETDNGNVVPQRTITDVPNPINLTVSGDELFVADLQTSAIYVFNKTDSGSSAPKRTIKNPTVLLDAYGVVVSGREIFVCQPHGTGEPADNVVVFNLSDDGSNVSPKRTIAGADTGFANPYGIDVAGGEIFVFDDNSVRVFPISADGNVVPSRVIQVVSGHNVEFVNSVVVGGEVFVSNYTDSAVYVYNVDDSGSTVAKRTIEGVSTGIDYPYDVFVSLAAPPPHSIPTLSEWGMIILSLLLAGSAYFVIRRRQSALS